MTRSLKLILTFLSLISYSIVFAEEDSPSEVSNLSKILIEGKSSNEFGQITVDAKSDNFGDISDSGDFLRNIPGVSVSRMGGHGLEPIIQGQQQSQLNVTDQGAFVHGGCPNRMDPPSSLSNINLFDQLKVDLGYQTVTNGPGGSGGSIDFIRDIPEDGMKVEAQTEYISNGDISNSMADMSWKEDSDFVRLTTGVNDAGNYQDGHGNLVRSSFSQYSGILELGREVSDSQKIRFSMMSSDVQDALFAGAGMDSPGTTVYAPKLEATIPLDDASKDRLDLMTYASFVNHEMDNYSLRAAPMMLMRAPSESDTFGGKIAGTFEFDTTSYTFGVDSQIINREAKRYSGMQRDNVNNLTSFLWPDVTSEDFGVFSEVTQELSATDDLIFGLRLDSLRYSADAADTRNPMMPMSRSANMLYQHYYGEELDTETEFNPTSFLRYEHQLTDSLKSIASYSYVSRTADATERSIASESMSGNWVGNPDLDPERHRQIQTGLRYEAQSFNSELLGFYNSVQDYILRDTARGQEGILQSDGASIYRNVGAHLMGVNSNSEFQINDQLKSFFNVNYTYGQNMDTDSALPQIPAFNGQAALDYELEKFLTGVRTRFAFKQNRVDEDPLTGTGRDNGQTPGYAVIDLYAKYKLTDSLNINFGISNLFDKYYANHLNRANAFDPEEVQVNEPGRAFLIGLSGRL